MTRQLGAEIAESPPTVSCFPTSPLQLIACAGLPLKAPKAKAKAKGKAKAKAAPKGKAKAKAKAKAEAKAAGKEKTGPQTEDSAAPKETAEEGADGATSSGKRPKKTVTPKELQDWANAKAEESDAQDAEYSSGDEPTRDGCKARWLSQKRKSGALLPQSLLDILDREDRETKTKAINKCVRRGSDGKFQLNLKNPWFQEKMEKYSEMRGEDTKKGLTLTVARQKCGGPKELDEALATGEVFQVFEDNTPYYVFKAGADCCVEVASYNSYARASTKEIHKKSKGNPK